MDDNLKFSRNATHYWFCPSWQLPRRLAVPFWLLNWNRDIHRHGHDGDKGQEFASDRGINALAGSKSCGRRIRRYNGSLQYAQGGQPGDRNAVKSLREVDRSSRNEMKFRCLA